MQISQALGGAVSGQPGAAADMPPLQTDYLVKGCGATAMAFVDVMLKETDANFIMVDKRAATGGHWNDAYPFVRLHQPSACYGVASRALGHGRTDSTGFNQGLLELASGFEVTDYFHQLMRDTFLASGRVRFYPVSELVGVPGSGTYAIRSLLSGATQPVNVRKRLVDATMTHTSIPLTHTRKFSVADGVTCVPPNDLVRLAPGYRHYTVMGAGKTAIDSVIWLLANGAPPQNITWVLPRDPWLLNRAQFQPGLEYFNQSIGGVARQFETFAKAGSVRELCLQMEAAGIWMRLDPNVWPTMFHGATVTLLEHDHLRGIKNMVRMGRVRHIDPHRVQLERGELPSHPETLYVDCTARAIEYAAAGDVAQSVFEDALVRLHMIRIYQPTFSAALIGHMEATMTDDAVKRQLCQPTPMTDTVEDYLQVMSVNMRNQAAWNTVPELRNWIRACRLDWYGETIANVSKDDAPRREVLARLAAATGPALVNLQRLTATAADGLATDLA
jgi:hypothetical protein